MAPAAAAADVTVGKAAAPVAKSHPKGGRRIPRGVGPSARATAAPRAQPSALAAAPSALLANFDGVSSRDSAVTNFGQEFEPPDQALCVGNGYVLEMVNSAYTVYKPNGTVVTGPFNVNGPFNEGLTEFTTDPRCHYDTATHTWIATILFISSDFTTSSHIDVAVNTSGDPTKLWKNYKIDTTDNGGATGPKHPGCPCLGDQPTLGIDEHNLYVTTNEFSLAGDEFNGAQIYAIAKKDLVSLAPSVHFAHFDNLKIGGAVANSVQPALTTPATSPAEYFLSSLDPNGTFDQRVGVWAMTNRAVVATGGRPKLTSVVLHSEAYGIPPPAQQKGSDSELDSGDDRMQQVQYVGGSVWGELGTAVTIPGDPQERAGAAWFEVRPTLSSTGLTGATMRRQGYVVLSGNWVMFPALQVTPSGAAAMVVSLSGKSRYPSAAYTTMAPGASSFGPLKVAAAGSGPYDAGADRWGDYSWAILDPGHTSVWLATEYIPPKARQTADRVRNWGTRVLQVRP